MTVPPLPDNSTLRTVAGSLTVEYVRRVLQNLAIGEKAFGDAQVRISLDGTTAMPDYFIETVMDAVTGQPMTIDYPRNGRTHKPLPEGSERNWSNEPMTRPEVSELIGELRHYKPNGKTDANT